MFYLLPYSKFKHCFLNNWIPSEYSILAMQVTANLHGQSKKSGNRKAGGDAPSTNPLCEMPCPLSHPSLLHSSLTLNQGLDRATLQAEALCVVTYAIRHLQLRFSKLVCLEGSSPEGSLASTASVENASVPKAPHCISKKLLQRTYGASLSLQAAP